MPTPEYKDLIIKQVAEGIPVLVCNGLHYAVDLKDAIWKVIQPAPGAQDQRWEASVQLGSWKLTGKFDVETVGRETTVDNATYTESTVSE